MSKLINLKLTDKKLYLTIRHFLGIQFNQALKENKGKEARRWRDEIEKVEMRHKANDDLSEYGKAIFEEDTDEFSIENIIKSGREGDEQAEREREERNSETEFCKNYKPEKGEIDVRDLNL